MKKQNKYSCVLTIAGSDSSGGAGVQADIKTISALGSYAASVITAITAQNTQAVLQVHSLSAAWVAEQLDAVLSDIEFSAVKIGMLSQPDIADRVADKMKQWKCPAIILDPVMISKSGCQLISQETIAVLTNKLLPNVMLMTPNIEEANVLLGCSIRSREEMQHAARELAQQYKTNVLVKGGHLESASCADVLFHFNDQACYWFEANRIDTPHTHGTGCTLSAAIATYIAQGISLTNAISFAKTYLLRAIKEGSQKVLGKGRGPVHHGC